MSLKLVTLITTFLVCAGLFSCKPSGSQDPRTEVQLVEITTIQSATTGSHEFTGVVTPRVESDLGFRVAGKVVERLVDAGQTVRAGQPLMRMDSTDFDHAVTAQIGGVAAARARFAQAAADETRFRSLVASGAISRSVYDQAKASADSARALLSASEAQLKIARDERAYSTLLADADGTIVETLVEPGQYVSAGQIVLKLAHAGPREAAVNLPETLRPSIGSSASASIYGSEDRVVVRLRQLSDAADPVTRTYEARYVLDGPAAQAPLGATVTITLATSSSSEPLAAPLGAIDDEGHGPGVWLYDAKRRSVFFRRVTIVRLESERAVVQGGLKVGSAVVAMGGHYLHEGQRVRVASRETTEE